MIHVSSWKGFFRPSSWVLWWLFARYDRLLWRHRRPGQSAVQPKASVVGVTIMSDVLEAAAFSACAHDKVRE